ncbi:hypothetical protein D1159_17745 [Pseudoflavonifractor sp. 524-17]|uniref:YcxB family protein n=1 Tax=Pseudoflavonifractor sp. 524-17 TaxID=2304577 RepID=UPI00137AD850|nr:YcxB family protein [Pseudoflavonifractor sp. 524-17]NCE66362.1 hypothetical protein [Pseudoflavonifractor sp. 524-17]
MENYNFQITPYDIESLLPQVSKALEKRTEFVSRERYPGLWENIDKLNAVSKGKRRSSLRSKIMSIICLVLGVFLFVPGLMKPQELLVPLLVGAFAIVIGIVYLYIGRKDKKNPFDKSARLLLMGKDTISAKQSIMVSFSESGMEIRADDREPQHIPYSDFESMIETEDLFLFVHDTRITVLQKKDLTSNDITDFRNFISRNVPQSIV